MSKWYAFNVEVWKRVLVEVQDDEDMTRAEEIAYEEHLLGKEGSITPAYPEALAADILTSEKRHADDIMHIPASERGLVQWL